MRVDTFRSRVLGSLLAGAVGDALGAPVEFWRREQIVAAVGPGGVCSHREVLFGNVVGVGLIIDDTQMTPFTMEESSSLRRIACLPEWGSFRVIEPDFDVAVEPLVV